MAHSAREGQLVLERLNTLMFWLATGTIGWEVYSAEVRKALARVGW